jgi:2-polyprenyl-3-methyl-5-hydroxy-6-metoxy-1,4-benzoquinol methylase
VKLKKLTDPIPKKEELLGRIGSNSKVLDIGCGNNGPELAKNIQPTMHYVGVDVENYNQTSSHMADEYYLFPVDKFISHLDELPEDFDYVICMHVLEHSQERHDLIRSMCRRLKTGGSIFLTFPNQISIFYPSRDGTLNYYDDPTHVDKPPSFSKTIAELKDSNMKIINRHRMYTSPLRFWFGLKSEFESIKSRKVLRHTWALWGFESVIVAKKLNENSLS